MKDRRLISIIMLDLNKRKIKNKDTLKLKEEYDRLIRAYPNHYEYNNGVLKPDEKIKKKLIKLYHQ